MKNHLKGWLPHLGFIAILLLFSSVYYGDIITKLPFGIHEWAQGDRLALAINFYDNGLNFFKPATQSQFSTNGIVGVEFPVQSYIAAALGYVFGRGNISTCFRIVDILIAWLGLCFLFRIVYDRTKDFIWAIIPPILIFCSPVFVYYSGNYQPDPASVSISLIAFYFFLQYADTKQLQKLLISIALLTLSVLIKATTVAYWAGIVGYALYNELVVYKAKRRTLIVAVAAGMSVTIVCCELQYIQYLNDTYHSTLFLSKTSPFKNWDAFIDYINFPFKDTWMKEYFLLAEYPVIAFIVAMGLHALFKLKQIRHYLQPVLVFLAGAIVLFYLFGSQMNVHDYYMLAIVHPLIAYLLAISMIGIQQYFPRVSLRGIRTGLFTSVVLIFFLADHQIYNRLHLVGNYNDSYAAHWLTDAASLVDSARIPRSEHIVVAGEPQPNLSLVYFDRKGYVLPPEAWNDDIGNATRLLREKHLRYLVIRETAWKSASKKDSAGMAAYDLISLARGTAMLRLRP